jgi:hypothetical protein
VGKHQHVDVIMSAASCTRSSGSTRCSITVMSRPTSKRTRLERAGLRYECEAQLWRSRAVRWSRAEICSNGPSIAGTIGREPGVRREFRGAIEGQNAASGRSSQPAAATES